ncbi:hypothetical protein L6R52_34635, partial [Myxococcota bacterium]|nr:hypothetical protein [Myxococcota bacterium]
IAARLARELQLAQRFEELAALERRRAEVESRPRTERAERWVEAARLAVRLGRDDQAEADVRAGLVLLEDGGARELEGAALDVLEAIVRRQGTANAPRVAEKLSEIVARRARTASTKRDRERLRLEQAAVLERAGLAVRAVKALEEATDELPSSVEIARALGHVAERAGKPSVAAASYGRAARLAAQSGDSALAIELHGRAAEVSVALGDVTYQVSHDRALLALCPPGSTSPWLAKAVERLEAHARAEHDHVLLVEVLARRAATSAPADAARRMLEKAAIELGPLANPRASLDSLRRAKGLVVPARAPIDVALADTIDERLALVLAGLGMFTEQAEVLVERAERATDPTLQSELFLAAALVHAGPLADRGLALSRAQAAIRASTGNTAARELRLRLLREGGKREPLVDALAEEATLAKDETEAAAAWVEAARILAPVTTLAEAPGTTGRGELERALDYARRGASAQPSAAEPPRLAAIYTRALARADEEFVALEQLVDRDVSDAERIAAYLRRVELLSGALGAPATALGELDLACTLAEESKTTVTALAEHLPAASLRALGLEGHTLPEGILRAGIRLTEETTDWAAHVRFLSKLVDRAEAPVLRADLRTQAGEVLEWKLGDGQSAEREYLAALALVPEHERARTALKGFYVAADRYAELAENLGVDTLREVWRKIRDVESPSRVLAAGEALWPILPEPGAERAEVQLALSDLYTTEKNEPDRAVELLELVVKRAPAEHQSRALERLSVLFLEQERFADYVDVLRRQTERVRDDKARAVALSDLGDALEWKLGDGPAAEREYRAAMALDPACESARQRLEVLLSSQDRFDEIGRDLGTAVLHAELDRMMETPRGRARAWKAAQALAALLPAAERGAMWLEHAERVRGEPDEREALVRAGAETSPVQAKALDRLIALFDESKERTALANVLAQRISIEPVGAGRVALHHRLGALLLETSTVAAGRERQVIESQAESELRAALAIDQDHAGVRALLETAYVRQGRLADVGRVLGLDTLRAIRTRADADGDRLLLGSAISALAELTSGEERATHLVELVELAGDGAQSTAESLYRAALEAHAAHLPAREGLRALYESESRFKDIAQVLGVDALRETLEQLRRLEDRTGLLPAALALSHALVGDDAAKPERAALLLEIASLQLAEDDAEAGEHALREALALAPDHATVREELRQLLVAQRRLVELADVDESLVAETSAKAAEAGDVALEIAALSVLADRRDGERRADTLVLVAALERRRDDARAAEVRLRAALDACPSHALAKSELEAMLWAEERYAELADVLGERALVARARHAASELPEKALAALDAARTRLSGAELADVLELAASIHLDDPDDVERRLGALTEARSIWDNLEQYEGRERVRLAIAELRRGLSDRDALLDALEDAAQFARDRALRASLAVERGQLLASLDRGEEARALVDVLVDDEAAPATVRFEAARLVADALVPVDADELADLELRARALELLTATNGAAGADRARWLVALAGVREALGQDEASIAEPLEQALASASTDEALVIRRRLRELYDQLGDWARAASHAAVIAETDDRPELWVQLAELRLWLADRDGAQAALERALAVAPSFAAAHEALLRLAEQDGRTALVVDRLEAWAEHDQAASRSDRAERLVRAAKLAAELGDADRAARLSERVIELLPPGDPRAEALAMEVCALLEPLDRRETMVALLARVVGAQTARSSELRLRLADLLESLGRTDEATTVVDSGIHRLTPEDDPLIERLVQDAERARVIASVDASREAGAVAADEAARRLLRIADRLGGGPTARRLRLVGAECAEKAGELLLARTAWSTIAAEVGVGDQGVRARQSLLRLARSIDDPEGLVSALVEASEDARSHVERASLLGEAAQFAQRSLEDADRAEVLLEKALAADPENPHLEQSLLALLEARGRWLTLDEKLEARAARLAPGPEQAALFARIGDNARRRLFDAERAVAAYTRAYAAEATLDRGLALVEALITSGRHTEAASWAEKVEVAHAATADAGVLSSLLFVRAEALEKIGALDAAVEVLLDAKRRVPSSALAEARLVELLASHERWRELADALGRIAALVDPGAALRHHLTAARLQIERVGDRDAAKIALARALESAERWLSDPDELLLEQLASTTSAGPLAELASLALRVGATGLRVDALRLRAQSLPEGAAQLRALTALG